jgi:hypothetical protein
MYHVALPNIEYDGGTGENENYQIANGLYPMEIVKENIKKQADYIVTSTQGNKFPSEIQFALQQLVVYVDHTATINQNIIGSGILFIDGDLTMSGNMTWNGLILVNGNVTFNGGGATNSTMVTGSVIALGNAIAINGGVDIIYDCRILSALSKEYTSYKRISWRKL